MRTAAGCSIASANDGADDFQQFISADGEDHGGECSFDAREEVDGNGRTDESSAAFASVKRDATSGDTENQQEQTGSRKGDDVELVHHFDHTAEVRPYEEQRSVRIEFLDHLPVDRLEHEPFDNDRSCRHENRRNGRDDNEGDAIRFRWSEQRCRASPLANGHRLSSTISNDSSTSRKQESCSHYPTVDACFDFFRML